MPIINLPTNSNDNNPISMPIYQNDHQKSCQFTKMTISLLSAYLNDNQQKLKGYNADPLANFSFDI
jgi:hypothetical protein